MKHRHVRVGQTYRYDPVFFDILNPPYRVAKGDIVTVIRGHPGTPPPNTMGMCYVAKDGEFAGMVMTNSLVPVRGDRPR